MRVHLIRPFVRLLLPLVVGLLATTRATALEILIPAYFDPVASATEWSRIANAAGQNYRVTTIINPNSGPLAANDPRTPSWLDVTDRVNCTVCSGALGFVYTQYGLRPLADVQRDIIAYKNQGYDLTGIFIDEMPSWWQLNNNEGPLTSRNAYLDYYSKLYAFIKNEVNPNWRVVGNPGTRTDEVLIKGGEGFGRAADSLVVLEQSADVLLNTYSADAWNRGYSDDIGYIIHTTASNQFDDVLARIRSNGGDIAYITAGSFPNFGLDARYTQLTGYWDRLLANAEVCEVPEPASALLIAFGLAGIAFTRRRRAVFA